MIQQITHFHNLTIEQYTNKILAANDPGPVTVNAHSYTYSILNFYKTAHFLKISK